MKKILLMFQNAELVGGVEYYLKGILPFLICRAEVRILFALGNPKIGVTNGLDLEGWRYNAQTWEKNREQILKWKPDIVINHGIHQPNVIEDLSSLPIILFPHDYFLTCLSGTKRTKIPFKECNRKYGLGCLARYFPQRCGGRNPLTMIRIYFWQKKMRSNFKYYQKILVASKRMQEEFVREGFNNDNVIVVPYPPSGVKPLDTLSARSNFSNRLLFVGRLVESKGWQDAIIATNIARKRFGLDFCLAIAGTGPDREVVIRMEKNNPGFIKYLGNLDSSSLAVEFSKADVLLVPSKWPEPFGLVGLEAMSQGLPSVAYNVGGITQWLESGVTGEVGPPGVMEPEVLVDGLQRLLGDFQKWQLIRENCLQRSKLFSFEEHLEALFKAVD